VIFTNGSALTERTARALHAAGLDEVNLSVHGFDEAAYESVMVGLSYERLRRNLRRLLELRRAGELPGLRVKLVAVDLPAVLGSLEERDRDLFAEVLVKATSNERDAIAGAGAAPRRRPCQRPFVKAYVLFNGDLVLCNVDWRRSVILGNVAREPIEAIWRSARYRAVRSQHLAGAFEPGLLCAGCDYPAVTAEDD
jgi:MoaA/NifB/PqqE/SkfB family radical SAM enzyme